MSNAVATGPRQQNALKALAWMSLALASFSIVAVAGRECAAAMAAAAGRDAPVFTDTLHMMFFRSVIGLVLISIMIQVSARGWEQIGFRRIGLHTARNSVHFFAQFSWLHALSLIPLSQLFALEFTAPLWLALLAWLLLGERFTPPRILAAILGFVGIMIVVQPGATPLDLGSILALASAVGFALSMAATKRLVSTETASAFLFHMSWMQTIAAGILVAPVFVMPNAEVAFWVSLVGICGVVAHYSLASAFAEADAMIVAPMDFMRLPLITAVGAILYGEALQASVLIGGLVIVAANVLNLYGQRRG